jgi:hypothetical protein
MEENKVIVPAIPVVGVNYTMQVGDGKTVVFQTHIDRDVTQGDLDALLDKFRRSCDRQVGYSKLESVQSQIEHHETQIAQLTAGIKSVDAKMEQRRGLAEVGGGRRIAPAEAQKENVAREQAVAAALQQAEQRDRLQRRYDELKAELEK